MYYSHEECWFEIDNRANYWVNNHFNTYFENITRIHENLHNNLEARALKATKDHSTRQG